MEKDERESIREGGEPCFVCELCHGYMCAREEVKHTCMFFKRNPQLLHFLRLGVF